MPSYEKDIARASKALQKGRTEEAIRLLSRILKVQPENASAHNLSAITLMQRGDTAQALLHAQEAVELNPGNFRYRTNLGATLMIDGQLDVAMTHLDQAIAIAPDYHLARRNRGMLNAGLERFEEAVADLTVAAKYEPNRVETRIALADALIELGRFDNAAEELREAEKIEGKQTAHWQYVWGRLMYRVSRFADARFAFTAALLADSSKMEHFIALAAASFHCGDLREAERATQATFQRFPYAERTSGTPDLRVLVLEEFGRNYFNGLARGSFTYERGNFIAHMPPGRIGYTHVISDCIDSIAEVLDLEQFDVAYNNRVVRETIELRDQEEQFKQIISELPVPLINRPEAVAYTTRDGNAERYAASEKFLFPRTVRIEHGLDPSPTKSQILDRLRLPIILRPITTHVGAGAQLAHNERELEEEIAKRPFSDFYAIEYHDCQSDDGLFRRYRFACIDGRLLTNSFHIARQWNVHGAERGTFDWFERGFDRDEEKFYDEPGQLLGAEPEDVFEEIVKNTSLDIYGFDYGFRTDGRLVVFEINAAMALGMDFDFAEYPNRKPYADRTVREIEALFFARSRENGVVISS